MALLAPMTRAMTATSTAPTHPFRLPAARLWLPVAALALLLAGAAGVAAVRRFVGHVPLPTAASVDLVRAFFDTTPVTITTTLAWTTTPETVEMHRLRTDWTVWRRMFFRDWDRLSDPPRRAALVAMIDYYRPLLASRTAGAALTPFDWDMARIGCGTMSQSEGVRAAPAVRLVSKGR